MAKSKNVESDAPVIKYEADPESFKTIVLKVHKKLDTGEGAYVGVCPISAGEKDAMMMSVECPDEPCLTIYQNGIPVVMSVNELIRDTLISILCKTTEEEN